MRIWIVTNIDLAGATRLRASGIQNVQSALALTDLGHEVVLWVSGSDGRSREFLANYLGREIPKRFRLMPFRRHGAPGEKKTPFATPLRRLTNTWRARLRFGMPDIVLTRSPRVISQVRERFGIGPRTPVVLEYQHPEYALLWRGWRRRRPHAPLRRAVAKLRQLRDAEFRWLRQSHGVLCAARDHERLLRHSGYDGPSAFLPSSCPPPQADFSSSDDADFDFGYIGSLEPGFGLETVLDAAAELRDARLLVVGAGTDAYRNSLWERAQNLALGKGVEFRPAVDFREVRTLMRRCAVGLVPLSARCGPEKRQWASPLNLFEWMAAGRAVVASDVPSVTQHVRDGCEAVLFRADDPQSLVAALRRVRENKALREACGKAGLEQAARHTYARRAERMLALFREVRQVAERRDL